MTEVPTLFLSITELELRYPVMKNGLTSVEASPFYLIVNGK